MADTLIARLRRLCATRPRTIVGITGCPGAGKSTLAGWIIDQFGSSELYAAGVPMDGFHFANAELERLEISERKGAIDTFDAYGYLAALSRTRRELSNTVYVPAFDRRLEEPIAGAIAIPPRANLIVTEGNYLLDPTPPWPKVRARLDEVWFCDIDNHTRRERLEARHLQFGKTPSEARRWLTQVDELNAQRIAQTRGHADLAIRCEGSVPEPVHPEGEAAR